MPPWHMPIGLVWRRSTRKPIQTRPTARRDTAMAFDEARGVLVVFGGVTLAGVLFDDTWEWNGNDWTQVLQFGPSARRSPQLVYDPARARCVLLGGAAALLGAATMAASTERPSPATGPRYHSSATTRRTPTASTIPRHHPTTPRTASTITSSRGPTPSTHHIAGARRPCGTNSPSLPEKLQPFT